MIWGRRNRDTFPKSPFDSAIYLPLAQVFISFYTLDGRTVRLQTGTQCCDVLYLPVS